MMGAALNRSSRGNAGAIAERLNKLFPPLLFNSLEIKKKSRLQKRIV